MGKRTAVVTKQVTGLAGMVARLVDDPMVTPAQLAADRAREDQRAALTGRRPAVPAGKLRVEVRMATLIGGLARLDGLSEVQVAAAARYRSLWDGVQIGAARALDYGRVRVDGGGAGGGQVVALDAFEGYRRAVQALGMVESRLFELVVCHDMSVRAVVRAYEGGDGRGERRRVERRLRDALDLLAGHFGLEGAGRGSGIVGEGERAAWDTGA